MHLQKGKQYRVTWRDIHTNNDWLSLNEVIKEVKELKTITSHWYYLDKLGDWYIFSSGKSKDKEPQYFDWVAVPKGCIKKIKETR